VATVAKAQQEPQEPWFLTSVTAPFYLQSMEDIEALADIK